MEKAEKRGLPVNIWTADNPAGSNAACARVSSISPTIPQNSLPVENELTNPPLRNAPAENFLVQPSVRCYN